MNISSYDQNIDPQSLFEKKVRLTPLTAPNLR